MKTFRTAAQLFVLLTAIILFMGAGDDSARFRQLGHQLMCPCGCGQVLLECNHVGCAYSERMRGELTAGIDRGDNDSLVLQSFVQKYGSTVLAAPTATGFNRVAWIMPFVALCGGLLLIVVIVRVWRHKLASPAVIAPASLDSAGLEALRRRVHEETQL